VGGEVAVDRSSTTALSAVTVPMLVPPGEEVDGLAITSVGADEESFAGLGVASAPVVLPVVFVEPCVTASGSV